MRATEHPESLLRRLLRQWKHGLPERSAPTRAPQPRLVQALAQVQLLQLVQVQGLQVQL
jgi:hypothetical protein